MTLLRTQERELFEKWDWVFHSTFLMEPLGEPHNFTLKIKYLSDSVELSNVVAEEISLQMTFLTPVYRPVLSHPLIYPKCNYF
jgi:hypothetical protein